MRNSRLSQSTSRRNGAGGTLFGGNVRSPWERGAVAGVMALALLVRFLPWKIAYAAGDFLFSQHDALYHLRRVTIYLNTFPRLPAGDTYMAYPGGAVCPWPPLYDLFLAGVAFLAGAGHPSPVTIRAVVSFTPPLLAALTVVPVFLLARRFAGPVAALVAVLFFSVSPQHVLYSIVGSGDHHTAEVLLLAAFLHLLLSSLPTADRRASSRRAVAAGAALGASVLVWQGAIVFALLPVGALFAWLAALGWGRPRTAPAPPVVPAQRAALQCLATALGISTLGRLAFPAAPAQPTFDFGYFSWFQPLFLLIVCCCALLLLLATRRFTEADRAGIRRGVLLAAAGCALVVGGLLATSIFGGNVADGVRFVATRHPWLARIREFAPPFSPEMFQPPLSWPAAVLAVELAEYLLPVLIAGLLFVRRRRRGEPLLEVALLLVWSILFCALALKQRRWANAYALNMAIGIGGAVALLRDALGAPGARKAAAALRRLAPAAAASLAAVPHLSFLFLLVVAPQVLAAPVFDESLIWLRDHTPPTKALWNPRERPEYAVYAYWHYGHAVQYLAERPTIVNNFGYQLPGNGLEDALAVIVAPDERALAQLCDRRGIRYLLLTDVRPYRDEIGRAAGIDVLGADFMSRPYARMYFSGWPYPGPLFRQVYETPPGAERPGFGRVRIFEYTPPAGRGVTGAALPAPPPRAG